MLTVAILAGGLATRLHPLTKKIPKALLNVSGHPFIFHQLLYLRKQGIKKVVLCVGHLGEMIESYVGDGSKFDLEVVYSSDQTKLLGTGGAIKKAIPLLGEKFFILYGDTFLPISFDIVEKEFTKKKLSSLMTILKNNGKWDKSNVLLKPNQLIEYNKQNPSDDMNYIDYGLSILNSYIFDIYPKNYFFDLSSVFEQLSNKKQLWGFEVYERFYEIGTSDSLKETENFISNLNY